MRRWLGRLAACSLLALAAAGCHHTAGVCDCDPGHCPLGCYGGVMGHHAVSAVASTPPAKTVTVTPMTKAQD